MPDSEALYTVQVDIYIARRKRIHEVQDAAGVAVYHDPHLLNVLTWLAEQNIRTARFTDDQDTFLVTFDREAPAVLATRSSENG